MSIDAYTFRADIYCPLCIIEVYGAIPELPGDDAETTLDQIAEYRGIDRENEYSFDSWDFPKPIYDDQIEQPETCGHCGADLGETGAYLRAGETK